jgi:hypothetical protein
MSQAFGFLRRQFVIGRFYAPIHWAGTLLATTVMNLALFGGLVAMAVLAYQGSALALLPASTVAALVGTHWARAWMREDLGRKRFPHLKRELAVARRWDLLAGPVFGLMNWLGMVSAAFSTRVTWRGLRYRIFPGGQIRLLNREPEETADPTLGETQSMPFDHLRYSARRGRRLAAAQRPND